MAIFGSATPVSKIVTSAMPVFIGSLLRVSLGALVLAPFALRRRKELGQITRRDWLLICIIALFGMFGFSALMLYGMRMVTGVTGAIVMSTTPALTAAASMIFLRESASWRKLAAIALAVSGVLILQLNSEDDGGNNSFIGATIVLAAVCCEVVYTLVGKKLTEAIDPVLVAFLAAALSSPLFVPFAVWQVWDFDVSQVDTGSWIAVIWYGAGTLALGSWLWYSGIAQTQGSVAAVYMGVMPASALILSYVLLGEDFRVTDLAGFAVVFAGVILVSIEHYKMGRKV